MKHQALRDNGDT